MRVRRIAHRVAVLTVATLSTFAFSTVASSGISTSATPPKSTSLFSVSRTLTLATDGAGPFIVGAGNDSIFVVGTFDQLKGHTSNSQTDDLIRINLGTWRISAAARYPNETSVAFGDDALWWATGQYAFDIPAPDTGRVLFKLDPTNLSKEMAFVLPDRTLLVTVAGTSLWVATPTLLLRLNPAQTQSRVRADPGEGSLESCSGRNVIFRPGEVPRRSRVEGLEGVRDHVRCRFGTKDHATLDPGRELRTARHDREGSLDQSRERQESVQHCSLLRR
jgi:hypothetical protein